MKELSVEEKAKQYELALERCRKLYNEAKANEYNSDIEDYETIFPELKESEDERVRKAILALVRQSSEVLDKQNQNNMIAWLEKQGESIKIKKGKNYLCTKTHKYAGVEWIKGTKYYASDNYTLVNQGCEYYCPEYSKEEHNNLFEEVKCDGYVEKQGKKKSIDCTHTNVFTEKMAIWFNNNFIVHDEYGVISDSFDTKEEMFEDFKNYMKEE